MEQMAAIAICSRAELTAKRETYHFCPNICLLGLLMFFDNLY